MPSMVMRRLRQYVLVAVIAIVLAAGGWLGLKTREEAHRLITESIARAKKG